MAQLWEEPQRIKNKEATRLHRWGGEKIGYKLLARYCTIRCLDVYRSCTHLRADQPSHWQVSSENVKLNSWGFVPSSASRRTDLISPTLTFSGTIATMSDRVCDASHFLPVVVGEVFVSSRMPQNIVQIVYRMSVVLHLHDGLRGPMPKSSI